MPVNVREQASSLLPHLPPGNLGDTLLWWSLSAFALMTFVALLHGIKFLLLVRVRIFLICDLQNLDTFTRPSEYARHNGTVLRVEPEENAGRCGVAVIITSLKLM